LTKNGHKNCRHLQSAGDKNFFFLIFYSFFTT